MRVVILLALLGAAMAYPKNIQRIVGGEITTIDKYPYMANMQYGFFATWWSQACGGSLITNKHVLSAAHCFIDDPPAWWRVLLGTSFRETGGDVYNVEDIIIHEVYNSPRFNNDVAIVRLTSSVIFSAWVSIARVAGMNYNLIDNTRVTTTGWGRQASSGSVSNQLREVDVYTINQELCMERYAELKTQPGYERWPDVTPHMLCAGILDVGGKDACQGDSGGPLIHDGDIIVGIVSWGESCAHPIYPGVYARVSALSSWIVANAT